jgi:ubiquitin-protein ligase
MMPFECASNGMTGSFHWSKIRSRLQQIHQTLSAEVDDWRRQGAEQTQMLKECHDAAVCSCVHHLTQQGERIRRDVPDGASIGADPANACVWTATLFGPSDGFWDGGMFTVELVFPPDFPDAPPVVRFLTPIVHPQINGQGVPYLRALLMWPYADQKERSVAAIMRQLVELLSQEPSPEPATHINSEAAALYFSRADEERREYKRRVKRCVQRSMDM